MNRRLALVLSVTAFATLTSACSTFSDSNDVARVGEATLTDEAFEAQLTALGAPTDQPVSADGARAEITAWIQEQLASEAAQLETDEVAARYDAGFATSGTACASGIVVEDEATATSIYERLLSGSEFAEEFAAENLDTNLDASAGDLGCVTPEIVANGQDNPSVVTVAELSADDRLGVTPVLDATGSEAAWLVLRFQSFTELSDESLDVVTSTISAIAQYADADIFVDPRYGTFDTASGQVVGLG